MKLGILPSEYALAEKWCAARLLGEGYNEEQVAGTLKTWANSSGYRLRIQEAQRQAEAFLRLLNHGSNWLFEPVSREKENTERIWEITTSMGTDTGKHDATGAAYAPEVTPMFVLQNPDGTYLAPSGWRVNRIENARQFYSREEAQLTRSGTNREVVEV